MASYQVLVPASGDKVDALFIRDGYSFLAFLLPLPWLLFRRMWLHAALVVVAYVGAELLAEAFQIQAISMAVGLFVSLWLGFEGGHLRGQMLERRGWTLDRVIEAGRISDAEAVYFDGMVTKPVEQPPLPRLPERTAPAGAASMMALGLIDPRGRA